METVTLFGRQAVLEALADERVEVDQVVVSTSAKRVEPILAAASRRGLRVKRATAERVTRLSRQPHHDQGVVADVRVPGSLDLDDFLAGPARRGPLTVLVLDGVTNPGNVGMIIRTASGAGVDGVVLPRVGSPDLSPLVIKASAGVALRATLLRCATAPDALDRLSSAHVEVVGLAADGAEALFEARFGHRSALVLGNESEGVSEAARRRVGRWVRIPLANGVESLNVATAAAVACFELLRRREQLDPELA